MTWILDGSGSLNTEVKFRTVKFLGLNTSNVILAIKTLRSASIIQYRDGATISNGMTYGLKESKELVDDLRYLRVPRLVPVNPKVIPELLAQGFIIENHDKTITCDLKLTRKLVSILNTKG